MATQTAQILAAIQSAGTTERQVEALGSATFDPLCREVIAAMYDPFLRLAPGLPSVWEPAQHLASGNHDEMNAALEEEWEAFREVYASARASTRWLSAFAHSPAYPIYYRVLTKHVGSLSPKDANQWGNHRVFQTSRPSKDLPEPASYPLLTLAEPSGVGCFLTVLPALNGELAHVCLYHRDGTLNSSKGVHDRVVQPARETLWGISGLTKEDMRDGVVFEGYLFGGKLFCASDMVSAPLWFAQATTPPLLDRLERLFDLSIPGAWYTGATYLEISNDSERQIAAAHEVTDYPQAGVIAFDPSDSYPYYDSSDAWYWLRRPV